MGGDNELLALAGGISSQLFPVSVECVNDLESVPLECANEQSADQYKLCQKPTDAAAKCLSVDSRLACQRSAAYWNDILPHFLSSYLVALKINEYLGNLDGTSAIDFAVAISDIYYAYLSQCDYAGIKDVFDVIANSAEKGKLTEFVDYMKKTKVSDLSGGEEILPRNNNATLLLVKAFKVLYPQKGDRECLDMALYYFPKLDSDTFGLCNTW